MPPKLQDIAERTKTSVSTVSRVLSGGPAARRISPATSARVRAAAKRMGYRPNLIARTLRTRKSHTIGLLVSDIANPFFAQIGSAIEQSLYRHGYSLMLCNSGEDRQREHCYLQMLGQKAIDGLIIVPIAHSKKTLLSGLPAGLPVVVLDRPIPGIAASVSSDQDQSSHLLCDSLKRVGVRSVALVSGSRTVITHRRRAEIVAENFTITSTHEGPPQPDTGRHAYIHIAGRPQAIVCTNNLLAAGIVDSIASADRFPIIASFDEIPAMHLLPMPILTVCQDIAKLAESSVQQILALLEEPTAKIKPIILQSRAISNQAFQQIANTKN
jgi:LacI family transcriptional regulator